MTTSEEFVQKALAQKGDRYVWATETSPLDPDPGEFDCSELAQWAGARTGLTIPDGSWIQYGWTQHIPVAQGIATRGALLFVGATSHVHHVAISLGDGTTIEARGKLWGVGTWGAAGRFDGAGLIPGMTYVKPSSKPPVNQGGGVGIMPGSDGAAIKFLQVMLNIIRGNQKKKAIGTDGDYGNQTKAAVSEFQREWNSVPAFVKLAPGRLPITGGADPKTCEAIAIAVRFALGAR